MIIFLSFESVDDKDKFEYIYYNYKNLLLHKAYQILKNYTLAEDAVSEAYIRIYKNLHKISDIKSNSTIAFLVTITRNTSLTILDREKKNYTEEIDYKIEDDFNLENYVLSNISSERIFDLVNMLSEDLKTVFLLKYANDLSHREIANILNIKENTVTVRIYRAKKKIAELLKKEGSFDEKN